MIGILSPVMPVFGSDISTATYRITITIVNNSSTDLTNQIVPFTFNLTYYQNQAYVNAKANNTAMLGSSLQDTGFTFGNPTIGNTTGLIYVPSILANSQISYSLYIGGQRSLNSQLAYFPATTGMNTTNSTSLHLGSNFSITQQGYYNTASGGNLVNKPGAIAINASGGNLTAVIAGALGGQITTNLTSGYHTAKLQSFSTGLQFIIDGINQTTQESNVYTTNHSLAQNVATGYDSLDSDIAGDFLNEVGEYIANFPVSNITSLSFYIVRTGNPVGNVTYEIRKSSDRNVIVGTFDTIQAPTIPTTQTWVQLNASSPINNNITQGLIFDIRYSEGNVTDFIAVYHASTSVYGNLEKHMTVGGWVSVPGAEPTFRLNYDTLGPNVVPDTANDWQFVAGNSATYLTHQSIVASGIEVQNISWQPGAVFYDTTVYGNNATPTFLNISNANVSASMTSFDATNIAVATNWSTSSANSVGVMPGMPPEMFTESNATFPGASLINEVATKGNQPVALIWFILALGVCLLAGWGLHRLTGSLAVQVTIIGILVLLLSLIHIWPFWILIPYILMSGACLLASKIWSY